MELLFLGVLLFVAIGQEQARAGTPEDSRAALERLLEKGLDPNASSDAGWTPLQEVACLWRRLPGFWHSNLETERRRAAADVLLRAGATLDAFSAAGLGKAVELERLLAASPDVVRAVSVAASTALHWAAAARELGTLEVLLGAGAAVDARDAAGRAALHLAVETKDEGVLAALLASGANPSLADTNGMTPLHLVVRGNQLEAVKKLLAAGAVIDVENAEGHTPLSLATGPSGQAIAQLLIDHGADPTRVQKPDVPATARPNRVSDAPAGATPLHLAVLSGDLATVKHLLKAGADVNVTDTNGATALHTVFAKDPRFRVSRPAEIVSALVDAGANVNAVDAKGATALHLAVAPPYADKDSALEKVVAVLLESGADPNLRDTGQATPLHGLLESASAWRQGEVIRLLIDAGANAGLTDSEGNTALHILARGKTSAAEARWVALLVGGGADLNAINHHGETALHGVDPSNMGESMVRALVAAGADPTIRDASGRTVLALREFPSGVLLRPSRSKDYARALREGDLGLVQGFLDAEPALVSWHLKGGLSALQTASFYRQPEVVELLLARGANLDAFSATLLGRTQDLQLALESAPDTVRATHYWGATLLHHAVERGFLACAELLVAQGAQPNLLDDSGQTAWFLAKTNAFGEIADLLAQHGAKPSLMDATALADRQGVEAVLESGPGEVNYRSRVTGMTALHLAAAEGWVDGVGLLLRAGAAPDLPAWQLQRPLHYAARYDCAECVRVLTEAGAGTELTDRNGYTPLHFAALFGSLASARSLLDAGADPNAVGSFTPLQLALLAGRLPLVDLLLERGARADLRGKSRHTPLECVRGGILRPELLERFLAEPGLVLQSSTVAVPPQYALTNQLLSTTLEQRIRKALGRL